VPRTGLCRNCGQPMLLGIDAVWRHTFTHDGKPIMTRWCISRELDENGRKLRGVWGYYIWPLMYGEPEEEAASA
jgi:hypothetical protein